MRPTTRSLTVREFLRTTRRDLTSLLLVAAMIAPFIASSAGWPVQTPLAVSLAMHAAALVAIGLLAFALADRGGAEPAAATWRRWLLVPPLAVAFAVILQWRANVFYTERTLVDGMAMLFVLHSVAGLLRRHAVRRLDLCLADGERPRPWRRAAEWRRRLRARCLPATPGVRLSDALTELTGWLIFLAWTLIALEHRHPAGPLFLVAGAAQCLALLALVPDALAGLGWLGARASVERATDRLDRLALVREPTQPTASGVPHFLRRHS